MQILINILGFKIGWLSSVVGAATQMPWLGPVMLLVVLAVHLRQAERPDLEIGLVIACGVIGAWFDSILAATGWVSYPSGQIDPHVAPYWIVAMWMLFATTLNRSMSWLKGRLALAAVMGAVAGPMSYYAGSRLGGIVFESPLPATIALSIGWAAIMPVVVVLAERMNGFAAEPARATR
jgi:hypothetical protein